MSTLRSKKTNGKQIGSKAKRIEHVAFQVKTIEHRIDDEGVECVTVWIVAALHPEHAVSVLAARRGTHKGQRFAAICVGDQGPTLIGGSGERRRGSRRRSPRLHDLADIGGAGYQYAIGERGAVQSIGRDWRSDWPDFALRESQARRLERAAL